MQPKIDEERAQFVRDKLAEAIQSLEEIAKERPEHGEYVTRAKNHAEEAYMTLGMGMAKSKGLDVLKSKIGG